jgi:low temperature requirement protein LtrA
LQDAAPREQLGMAIGAFFYAFVVMLLGVVILAAGLALTIAAVDIRTSVETAALLGGGAATYVAGDVLFRGKLGIVPVRFRVAAIPLLLLAIPLGSGVSGMAQLLAIIAVFVAVLLFEKRARAGAFTAPG